MPEKQTLGRILIVDDQPEVAEGLSGLLEDDWEVRIASTGREATVAFAEFSPDVVLLDINLPDLSGLELLDRFKMYSENTAIIMMSGQGDSARVVESMRLGAETFLQKPFDADALDAVLTQVAKLVTSRRELIALRRTESRPAERLAGVSPGIIHLNDILENIARAPSPVLIGGESGTGKGVLARLIHNRSPRARNPFVDLNCAGLSKELLESELFGHERGSFTNATNAKQGLFELAANGTLFLDEIGDLELQLQARLLKAVEEKRFRRVGGVRDLRVDFRLIAATNRNLGEEVTAGRFRADLFYRLNVVNIQMAALRERIEDLPMIADELLRTLAKEMGRPVPTISRHALKKLSAYSWPGNIRELRNVLERSLIMLRTSEIQTDDLHLEGGEVPQTGESLPTQEWEIRPLDDVVADYAAAAVRATGGNMRRAARLLNISPSTLYARLGSRRANES
jgi:DNA-binding NtrC family response regulator